MQTDIVPCLLRGLIGIAILTSVQTAVVCADIAAFYTVASMPHSPVLTVPESNAIRTAEYFKCHAAGRMNAVAGLVSVCPASLNQDSVFPGNFTQSARQHVHVFQ